MNSQKNLNKGGFQTQFAPSEEDLYKCVHCGFCLNVCPTYKVTGLETESPRGRIALMKAVHEERTPITKSIIKHWELCLQCRACETACPSGVPYGKLMEDVRAELKTRKLTRTFFQDSVKNIVLNLLFPKLFFLKILILFLRIYRILGINFVVINFVKFKFIPNKLKIIFSSLPIPTEKPFKGKGKNFSPHKEPIYTVGLLSGCIMPLVHGNTMNATIRVLNKNLVNVIIPSNQGCCGALNIHNGDINNSLDMAKRNIDSFLDSKIDFIIVASAGCGTAMKEYKDILKDDQGYFEKALEVSNKTKDLYEFLSMINLEKPTVPINKKIVYQDPCHLINAQNISEEPRKIINMIPGIQFSEIKNPTTCCGSAGTYSLFEPKISNQVTKNKVEDIMENNPQIIATGNPGCAMQLKNYLENINSDIEVKYVVELLDKSYTYN